MTFELLADKVADDFKATMDEWGFGTFAEMRRSFDWEPREIKEEVSSIIDGIASEEYHVNHNTESIWMSDDLTFIQIGFDVMPWREFKKLVFANLK